MINYLLNKTYKLIKLNIKSFIFSFIITFVFLILSTIYTTYTEVANEEWKSLNSPYAIQKEYQNINILTNLRKGVIKIGLPDDNFISHYLKEIQLESLKSMQNKVKSNDFIIDFYDLRINYPKQIGLDIRENSNELNRLLLVNLDSYFNKSSAITEMDQIHKYDTIALIYSYFRSNNQFNKDPQCKDLFESSIEKAIKNINDISSLRAKVAIYFSYIEVFYYKTWGYTYKAIDCNYEDLKFDEMGCYLEEDKLFCKVENKEPLMIDIKTIEKIGLSKDTYNKILTDLNTRKLFEKISLSYNEKNELLNYTSFYGYTANYQENVCQDNNYLKLRSIINNAELVAKKVLENKDPDNKQINFELNNHMAKLILEYAEDIKNCTKT